MRTMTTEKAATEIRRAYGTWKAQGGQGWMPTREIFNRADLGLDEAADGIRHLIRAGVPPHTVMAMSGHRTASMLKCYDIISLDDLRHAAWRGSEYGGQTSRVSPLRWENP